MYTICTLIEKWISDRPLISTDELGGPASDMDPPLPFPKWASCFLLLPITQADS